MWSCPSCEDVREFVQPTCVDGHVEDGGECPEWACADCGTALVVGELAVFPVVARLRHAA
jgi:hypothetical protein